MNLNKAVNRDRKIQRRSHGMRITNTKAERDAEKRKKGKERAERIRAEIIENLTFDIYGSS